MNYKRKHEVEEATRILVDEGRVLEAGWLALRIAVLPVPTSLEQEQCMRESFYAGAHHLFAVLMTVLERGVDSQDKDVERIASIRREIKMHMAELMLKIEIHDEGN